MRLSILFLSLFSLVLVSCGGNKKADGAIEHSCLFVDKRCVVVQ